MGKNVAEKLIDSHLADGRFEDVEVGKEIDLEMDQTLTQDATGTMVMLEFEAMGIPRVQTELSAQYVDHNLIQSDFKNPDDHLFLRSACKKFGAWYSRPGNGVSHPVHQERFGEPGKTLIGSDSHSPAAGAIGMLAIGAGGLDVAMAMAGKPYTINMPEVWGVKLTGELPDWVSAKDVILTMLERHDVDGGVGQIIEYYGPGLDSLSCMDRHVIANMGTELGATSTVFPSDDEVRAFLRRQGREEAYRELKADPDATYDEHEEIDLSSVVPKIAKPSSPGNVVSVREVEGQEIYQSYVGSSANPGFRDFASAAEIVDGHQVHDRVSFDVNPTSRQILENLMNSGHLQMLTRAGARIHQAGCNGCIGMGQAPATGQISVRTVPRNFPGRSGTKEDAVYLVSPETAAASALTGEITDPRDLADLYDMDYPNAETPDQISVNTDQLVEPLSAEEAKNVDLEKGPNVVSLPEFEPLQNSFDLPVLLKVGDDISTDEIMPAGSRRSTRASSTAPWSIRTTASPSSAARTTGRDRAESTPPSRRGGSAPASRSPRATPGFTGKTWRTSASCRSCSRTTSPTTASIRAIPCSSATCATRCSPERTWSSRTQTRMRPTLWSTTCLTESSRWCSRAARLAW